MGMGGGSVLVPALSIIFGCTQIISQSTNVIVFIVISIFAVIIYTKNKLIDFKMFFVVSIPAVLISAISSIFTLKISSKTLKFCFAIFIIALGLFSFFNSILKAKKRS